MHVPGSAHSEPLFATVQEHKLANQGMKANLKMKYSVPARHGPRRKRGPCCRALRSWEPCWAGNGGVRAGESECRVAEAVINDAAHQKSDVRHVVVLVNYRGQLRRREQRRDKESENKRDKGGVLFGEKSKGEGRLLRCGRGEERGGGPLVVAGAAPSAGARALAADEIAVLEASASAKVATTKAGHRRCRSCGGVPLVFVSRYRCIGTLEAGF